MRPSRTRDRRQGSAPLMLLCCAAMLTLSSNSSAPVVGGEGDAKKQSPEATWEQVSRFHDQKVIGGTTQEAPVDASGTSDERRLQTRRGLDGAEWVVGEVLVGLHDGLDLNDAKQLAARYGAQVLGLSPRARVARLQAPEGADLLAFAGALSSAPEVSWSGPNRVIRLTSAADCSDAVDPNGPQWALPRMGADAACVSHGPEGPTGVRVAVLDTGLAYEDRTDGGDTYALAPGLADVAIELQPGADLVDGDNSPNDAHGHGTHIASIIASGGALTGVAPGVTLVPLRVLDRHGIGTEAGLIEALYLAAEASVDVINLSLAFDEAYHPSRGLEQAMRAATQSGAVVVASAGNRHQERVHYPAAFPDVIAVAAGRVVRTADCSQPGTLFDTVAAYSSWGHSLDITAPGGRISGDSTCDGVVDAIFAEGLNPDLTAAPIGMTGTSQAAAHVAAAAAWLLAERPLLTPAEVRARLLAGARAGSSTGFNADSGQGFLDLPASLVSLDAPPVDLSLAYVDIVPVLYSNPDGSTSGHAVVQAVKRAVDGSLLPLEGARLFVAWTGDTASESSALTDAQGYARFTSPATSGPGPNRLTLEVLAVVEAGAGALPKRPLGFYHLSEGLERGLELLYGGPQQGLNTPQSAVFFKVDPAEATLGEWFDLSRLQPGLTYRVLGAAGITAPSASAIGEGLVAELSDTDTTLVDLDLGEPLGFSWGVSQTLPMRFHEGVLESFPSVTAATVLPLDTFMLGGAASQPVINAPWDVYDSAVEAFNPAFAAHPLKDHFSALIVGNGYTKTIFGTITNSEMAGSSLEVQPSTLAGASGDGSEGEQDLGTCAGAGCSMQ